MSAGAHGVVRTDARYNRTHWPAGVVRCTTAIRAFFGHPHPNVVAGSA